MNDSISRQAAIETVKKHYRVDNDLLEVIAYEIEALPSAQLAQDLPNGCTDTISRAAVGDALNRIEISRNASWYEFYQKALTAVGTLPSAQPTLYGYDIKHLAFVASIMAKKGVSPEEAVTIFRDVNRVIEMMLEDMKQMQENALKQTLKKPWEGGQDGKN